MLYEEKVPSLLANLRSMGLNEKQQKGVFHSHPGLIEMPKSELIPRIGFLKTYLTNAEAIEVMTQSIAALVDNENIIKKKLEYLIKSVSHDTKDIASSRVLDYPLYRMKMRHEFLIRAGLFKPIPYRRLIKVQEKEKSSKAKRPKYFKPSEIVCSSDGQFLKACTKSTLTGNELAAFEEVFAREMADKVDYDSDNSESDSEDEGIDGALNGEASTSNSSEDISTLRSSDRTAQEDQFYY
jgi:predicted transcriptional regulator